MDNTVLMYGCPTIDYKPFIPQRFNEENPALIEHYKQKFIDLFKAMELELGKCNKITIEHGSEIINDDINLTMVF